MNITSLKQRIINIISLIIRIIIVMIMNRQDRAPLPHPLVPLRHRLSVGVIVIIVILVIIV